MKSSHLQACRSRLCSGGKTVTSWTWQTLNGKLTFAHLQPRALVLSWSTLVDICHAVLHWPMQCNYRVTWMLVKLWLFSTLNSPLLSNNLSKFDVYLVHLRQQDHYYSLKVVANVNSNHLLWSEIKMNIVWIVNMFYNFIHYHLLLSCLTTVSFYPFHPTHRQ